MIFGGIGLAALPLDLIYYFYSKPQKTSREYVQQLKLDLISDIEKVRGFAKEAQFLEKDRHVKTQFAFSKEKREYNDLMKKLRASVNVIDDQYKMIDMQERVNEEWVLSYYLSLIAGVVCLLISLTWVTHIVLYVVIVIDGIPVYSFLNKMLTFFQNIGVGFLSTTFFSLLCMYLLWCTIKGNLKFGLRIMMCMEVHPMKKDETYMNSFLFNIMMIMICSVSVTQFCSTCFAEYTSMTDINLIFGTQIKYLKFFRFFYEYKIFEYTLCVSFLYKISF